MSATEQDLDEIFACLERFIAGCWLLDRPDREHNPASNHLCASLGFRRVFSQGGNTAGRTERQPENRF